jgi:arylformamidase
VTLIDISPRVGTGAVVWPGDTPFALEVAWSPGSGDSVTVSKLTLSPHTGAHADAPLHVGAGPGDVASQPLEAYWGPCRVLDWRAEAARDGCVARVALEQRAGELAGATRVLFRTLEQPLATFPESFPHFAADAASWLAALPGMRLVGIDTFSVDAPDSKDLAAHHAFFDRGVAILEGLDLGSAAPGTWELSALPLRLEGADASPVRAALRRD